MTEKSVSGSVQPKRKKLTFTDSIRDGLALLVDNGMSVNAASKALGCSETSARYTMHVYRGIKDCDYSDFPRIAKYIKIDETVAWACGRLGLDLAATQNAIQQSQKEQEPEPQFQPKEELPAKPDANLSDLEDAIHVSSRLIAAEITSTINAVAKELLDKMEKLAVIIQSCSANEISKGNANADNSYREMQKAVEHLACIRSNTKKR